MAKKESRFYLEELNAFALSLEMELVEFQDISYSRLKFLKALIKHGNSKLFAVGDDWQSIYAFSGSEVELFTKFKEEMGYAEVLKITNTYRNSQELIDIAGNFIQKNKTQIQK